MDDVVRARPTAVVLNDGTVEDVSFLSRLKGIKRLDVLGLAAATDVSVIETLVDLEELNLGAHHSGDIVLDRLPRLRKAFLEWQPGLRSVTGCRSLTYLYVNSFKGEDLSLFADLQRLRVFRIGCAPRLSEMSAVRRFPRLRGLGVYKCPRVTTLDDAISPGIERLDIARSRGITDISCVAGAGRLNYLALEDMGEIASLTDLARLKKLGLMYFPGSTVIRDGRVAWIGRSRSVRATGFRNRRHYDATCAEVEDAIQARGARWAPGSWHELAQ